MKNAIHIASVATLAMASLWSSGASAEETMPTQAPPTSERPPSEGRRPNRPLLIAGGAVLAASYIPAVIVSITSDREGDGNLAIPIAGPWLDLGERGGCDGVSCGTEALYKGLLITAGVAHLVGAGLVLSSFLVPEKGTRTTAAATKEPTKPIIVPAQFGRAGAGLAMVGRF